MAKASHASIMATTLVGLLLWGVVTAKAEENKCGSMSEVMASISSWEVSFARSGFYPSEYQIEKFKEKSAQIGSTATTPGLTEAQVRAGIFLRLRELAQDPDWIAYAIYSELKAIRWIGELPYNPVTPSNLFLFSNSIGNIRGYLLMLLATSSYEDTPPIGDLSTSFKATEDLIKQKMFCLG